MILSETDLVRWGNRIGLEVPGPVFLGLKGPLGAGKSVLARAVARGAGVEGPIPSPTFNLVFRYATARGVHLVHMDLFRIEDVSEVWELEGCFPPAEERGLSLLISGLHLQRWSEAIVDGPSISGKVIAHLECWGEGKWQGTLQSEAITINKTTVTSFTSTILFKNGGIELPGLRGNFYGGQFIGFNR